MSRDGAGGEGWGGVIGGGREVVEIWGWPPDDGRMGRRMLPFWGEGAGCRTKTEVGYLDMELVVHRGLIWPWRHTDYQRPHRHAISLQHQDCLS